MSRGNRHESVDLVAGLELLGVAKRQLPHNDMPRAGHRLALSIEE